MSRIRLVTLTLIGCLFTGASAHAQMIVVGAQSAPYSFAR
jgi:hypothetical protein